MKLIDLSGKIFGRLQVISRGENKIVPSGQRQTYWTCKCDCGSVCTKRAVHLQSGATQSCGCKNVDMLKARSTHGQRGTRLYGIWCGILSRCADSKNENYGARGIKVCERWTSFVNFKEDMGNRPDGTEIDRIDNNGNYQPGNCRWATKSQQNRNKRSNVWIEIDGIRKLAVEWSEISGIPVKEIRRRVWRKWSSKDAVFAPMVKRGNALRFPR